MENRKPKEKKSAKTKVGSLKRSPKFTKLSQIGKEKRLIIMIRNERRDVNNNLTEIKRIVREYYEQFCANKLDNQIKLTNCYKDSNYLNLTKKKQKI